MNIDYLLHEKAIRETRFHLYDISETHLELSEADQYLVNQKVKYVRSTKMALNLLSIFTNNYKVNVVTLK